MKGLYSYIKNNHIIYKVSVISIILLMLISVVQINPKNMKEKNSVGDSNTYDYTIVYNSTNNKFYKNDSSVSSNEISSEELNNIGISASSSGNISLDNVNFTTKKSIALLLEEDTTITLVDETKNVLSASYNRDSSMCEIYGIYAKKKVTINGNGALDIIVNNVEDNGERISVGIFSEINSKSITGIEINSGKINIYARGYNGYGLYTRNGVAINGGNMKIYGGNKAYGICIMADYFVKITGGNIYLESVINNGQAYGIKTAYSYIDTNEYVSITGGKITGKICSDTMGAGIYTSKIDIVNNAQVSFDINGNDVRGLNINKILFNNEGGGINIANNANISITGDVNKGNGIYVNYGDINIKGGNTKIELKNTTNDNSVYGIKTDNNVTISQESNINISGGVIESIIDVSRKEEDNTVYGEAYGIYAIDNMTVDGGTVKASANGNNSSSGIQVEKVLNINDGYVIVKGKGQAINVDSSNITLKQGTGDEPSVSAIVASTDYDGSSLAEYDKSQISTYKYLEYGKVYPYFLYYDATEGEMYKFTSSDDTKTEDKKITNTELSGWSVGSNNELILSGLDFTTSCNKAIEVAGEGTVKVENGTENKITMTNTVNKETVYGIYCSDVLNVNGKGQLDIRIFPNNNIGSYIETIYAANGINIERTTINIDVKKNSDSSNKTYGIRSYQGEINISNSDICIELLSCNLVSGIFLDYGSNINIQNSNINMNIKADVQAEGIYSYSANIINSNLNLEILSQVVYVLATYTDIVVSNSYINVDTSTSAKSYGFYTDNYDENNKIEVSNSDVKLNLDNSQDTYGIYIYPEKINIINIDNSSVEIIAKNVMNHIPTLKNDINIAEARIGDTIVKPGVVDSVKEYDYVRIEPTYYITYNSSDKKIYKNDTTTEITVAGLSVDGETGHLIMDGFNFTTSNQFGIRCVGDTIIDVVEGSKNNIGIDNTGNAECIGIYSTNGLKIIGKGQIEYKGIANKITGIKAASYVNINDVNMDIDSDGVTEANGIIASQDVNIEDVVLKLKTVADNTKINGIVSLKSNVNIASTNINIYSEIVSNDTNFKMIYAWKKVNIVNSEIKGYGEAKGTALNKNGYYDSTQYFIYAEGYNFSADDISIKLDNVKIQFDSIITSAYAIENYKGQVDIDDCDININMLAASSQHNVYAGAIYPNHTINVDNANIYASSNATAFMGIMPWDGDIYIRNCNIEFDAKNNLTGIKTFDDNYVIVIDSSDINMKYKSGDGILTVGWSSPDNSSEHIIINNSFVNLDSYGNSDASMWGIFSLYGYLEVTNSNVQMNLDATNAYGIEVCKGIKIKNSEFDINTNSTDTSKNRYAVISEMDDLIIDSSTMQVNVNDAKKSNVFEIAGKIDIINADVDVNLNANEGNIFNSYGEKYVYNYDIRDYEAVDIPGGISITNSDFSAKANVKDSTSIVESVDYITFENSNIDIRNTNSTITNGKALSCDGTLTITGGHVILQATGQAINGVKVDKLTLTQNETYYTEVLKSSKVYDASDRTLYDENMLDEYKYLEIGQIYSYTLKYDVANNKFYKVYDDNSTEEVGVDELGSIGITASKESGSAVITLDNANFITSASKGLDIVGDATISLVGASNINVVNDNGIGVNSSGTITMNNGTIYITANQVMNVVPELIDISISEAKQSSDNAVVTPNNASGITNYNYVRIEPKFYLIWNGTTLLRSDTSVEASDIAGWRVENNGSENELVLDGLHFTTSNQYSLKCVGNTIIEIANNSDNYIINNCSTGDVQIISADNNLSLIGTGNLSLQHEGMTANSQGIAANNLTVENISLKIDINVDNDANNDVIKGYGLYTSKNVKINHVNIDINVFIQNTNAVKIYPYGIYAYGGVNISNNSQININTSSSSKGEIKGSSFGIQSFNEEIYIKDSTINIKEDNLKYGTGLYSDCNSITIINSNIIEEINCNEIIGIGVYDDYNTNNITIDNSTVDIDGLSCITNNNYGIYVNNYEGDASIVINSSTVNIDIGNESTDYVGAIYSYFDESCDELGTSSININDSDLNINCVAKKTYGIEASNDNVITNSRIILNANATDASNVGVGLCSGGNMIITGGKTIDIKASTKAIEVPASTNLQLVRGDTGEYSTEITKASTDYATAYTDSQIINYPTRSNIGNYKYVHIENMPAYTIRYDASAKQLSKQRVTNSGAVEYDVLSAVDGITIQSDGSLLLNNFNFTTTSRRGLSIVNGVANIVLASGSTSTIRTVVNQINNNCYLDNETSNYKNIALGATGQDINISGDGTLNLYTNVAEDLALGIAGTYIETDGIYTSENVTVNNGNINIKCDGKYFANFESKGIRTLKNITINGGNLDINVKGTMVRGLSADGMVITPNTYTGTIKSVTEGDDNHNITGDEAVNLQGGTITLNSTGTNSGKTTDVGNYECFGIYSYSSSDATKGKINIGSDNWSNKVKLTIMSKGIQKVRGIYSKSSTNDITIQNCEKVDIDIVQEGDDTGLTDAPVNHGIYSNYGINMSESDVDINMDISNGRYTYGICTEPDTSTTDSKLIINACKLNITIDQTSADSRGIHAKYSGLDISGSDVEIMVDGYALRSDNTTNFNVSGSILAGTDKTGTGATIQDVQYLIDNVNTKGLNYIKITGKVLSVNITWGNLDYTYTEGKWNTSTHQYEEGTWAINDVEGDKITVDNSNSTVPIYANIAYSQDSEYTATTITGNILTDKRDNTTKLIIPKKILAGKSLDTYLVLSGYLFPNAKDTKVGSVTVTISE